MRQNVNYDQFFVMDISELLLSLLFHKFQKSVRAGGRYDILL